MEDTEDHRTPAARIYRCLPLCTSVPTVFPMSKTKRGNGSPRSLFPARRKRGTQPAAFTMSKIGRYMATTMPPTTTPRNTIMTGSISERRPDTAASTSSS